MGLDEQHGRAQSRSGEVKFREVMKLIEEDGRRFHWQRGSRQYKHPVKAGRVTVAGKPSADVHPKTLADILKQAQIERLKT